MRYETDDNGVLWCILKRQRTKCVEFVCTHCGEIFFRMPMAKARFCSKSCANKYNAKHQSRTKRGPGSHNWKGGRVVDSNGYIKIWMKDHPCCSQKGYVLEHRLVMEQHMGRRLSSFETIHHKNGVRDDNRIENLQLMCSFHPQGQTPEDLVKWAKQILSMYETETP